MVNGSPEYHFFGLVTYQLQNISSDDEHKLGSFLLFPGNLPFEFACCSLGWSVQHHCTIKRVCLLLM